MALVSRHIELIIIELVCEIKGQDGSPFWRSLNDVGKMLPKGTSYVAHKLLAVLTYNP